MQFRNAAVAAAAGFLAISLNAPAHALSAKECSDKYKAAQTAGTLGGKSWNDFQRLECAVDAKPADAKPAAQAPAAAPAPAAPAAAAATPPAAAPAAAAPAAKGLTNKECSTKYQAAKSAGTLGGKSWADFRKAECAAAGAPATAAPAAAAVAPAGSPVFPSAIAPKYASEKPGKARMHTCLDQYKANKATGGNAGLVWIGRKGGGYYSACNKKLKG